MADERRHDHAQLVVDGQALAADLYPLITLIRVEESVQLPDSFVIRIDDPHFELFDRRLFRIGTEIEISFRSEGALTVVTTGEVTAIGVEQAGGGRHELVLQGLDVTHRLAREPKSRSFVQMTDADIAEAVAGDYRFETDIEATGEVREYVLQAAQTDLSFLRERAHRIGFDLWIAGGTLHYKRRPEAEAEPPALRWGDNLHKFKVRLSSAERCDEVVVRGWDPLGGVAVVGTANGRDPGTDAPAASDANTDARGAFGTSTRFAGQFPVASQIEAEALAQSLIQRASGGEVVVRGEAAGDPRIAAGSEVAISGVGERLAGRYLVTAVEHVYGTGSPYVTRFTCGGKDAGGIVDLLGGGGPAAGDEGRTWSGLVVGIVTNNDDPEKLARVKVKFPSLTDDDESTWARVVAPGAGEERGFFSIPEVGDEVLVGFELGDKLRPVIVGNMWNRSIEPPDHPVVGGVVESRRWISRTGHEIVLHDGDEVIEIVHSGGNSSIRIEADSVAIEAGQKISLTAPTIEIDGSSEVKVTGGTIRLN